MLSPIERLPVEVFDIIAADLHLPAYKNLRLVSRQLQLLTFSTFAKQHFHKRTTTLGSASLDRLIHVANHEHLRHAVKALHIRILNHRDYRTLKEITRVGRFPPPKRFPKVSGVRDEDINDESTTFDYVIRSECPKRILDGLVRALRGFSKLKTLRFRLQNVCHPDSTVFEIGDQRFRSKCFQVVLEALAKSEMKLEELSMAKGKRRMIFYKGANPAYLALRLSPQSREALQHCFSDLESLTLTVLCNYKGVARVPGWENDIGNFIATAPKLRYLALSLNDAFQSSRCEAIVLRSMATTCRIKALERFHLINCLIHAEDLITFIGAHGTLRQLDFSDIHFLTGTWKSVWIAMKSITSLKCVRLACLADTSNYVVFAGNAKDRPNITLDVGKDKRPMPEMLDDLITACDPIVDVPPSLNEV
jgi:hypothetical protein